MNNCKNIVHIYFQNGDEITKECADIRVENGFIIIIYGQYSEGPDDPICEAFNIDYVDTWELIRMKEGE